MLFIVNIVKYRNIKYRNIESGNIFILSYKYLECP